MSILTAYREISNAIGVFLYADGTKTPIRVEHQLLEVGRTSDDLVFSANTEEECINWIVDHTPVDLMGDVTYRIQKVYTNSVKR